MVQVFNAQCVISVCDRFFLICTASSASAINLNVTIQRAECGMEAEVNSIERGVLGRDGALKGEVRARRRPASLLYG